MFAFILPYTDILLIALAAISAILFVWVLYMHTRISKFMQGKNGASVEETLSNIQSDNKKLKDVQKKLASDVGNLDERLSDAARGIATVRFNAFSGRGESGAQSFATAILSESGNGIVISSIHTRDNTRVFTKPLKNFQSEHELTSEEKRAIVEARKNAKL